MGMPQLCAGNQAHPHNWDMACSRPRCREKTDHFKNLITPKSILAHLSLWSRLNWNLDRKGIRKINVCIFKQRYLSNSIFLFYFICSLYKTPVKVFISCYFRTTNALNDHTFVETNAQNNKKYRYDNTSIRCSVLIRSILLHFKSHPHTIKHCN